MGSAGHKNLQSRTTTGEGETIDVGGVADILIEMGLPTRKPFTSHLMLERIRQAVPGVS